jgi:outer membrane receptor protein involved in Fe transport
MHDLLQKLMLGCSTAAVFAAGSLEAVHAQQTSTPASTAAAGNNNDIEQVVVSASRISIAGYQQPTPVTVVGAAELEKNAYADIADAVRELPQVNSPPASFSASQGAASPGTSGVNLLNLRNLGILRTLILFDGQRVVQSNLTGGVDVTTIPSALVQRVDVVTGGASAAFGSDAVAGVVNFVLNKNYTGFKGSIQGSDTSGGLYREAYAQGAYGTDIFGGRGHFEFAATADIRPDFVLLQSENWYRGAYLVANPAYAAGNGQPIQIVANNVGLANATPGGLITASAAGTGANAAAANALRGIQFTGNGQPQVVNFGNITAGTLSNGGSLGEKDTEAPWQTIATPGNTYTMFAYGRYKLTDSIQASLQLNYGYFTGKGDAQSYQQLSLTVKSDNAYLPASVAAAMATGGIPSFTLGLLNGNNYNNYGATDGNYTQMAEASLAPAITFNRRQLMRGVFTLEGELGNDWSWNAYYQHSTTRYSAHVLGDVIIANLTAAEDAVTVTNANRGTSGLALGSIACRSSLPGQAAVVVGKQTAQAGCVPINVFGTGVASAAAINYAQGGAGNFEDMQLNQDVLEGSMQGTLPWTLPAGKVAVAFGAGYRKEAGVNFATQVGLNAGYAVANYTAFPSSSYNVEEGFLEVDAPILKNTIVDSLDFSAAGRMTSYSTSGLVQTWKLGLVAQVDDDFKLRTVWSVDIRAPDLQELFAPANVNTVSCADPKTGVTQTCVQNVVGNPNLVPEVARTISGGVVMTPHWVPGLSLSADWYNINLTGEVATISNNLILSTCAKNINDPLCSHLVFGGANGALSVINNVPLNFASLRTSGMDISGNYLMEAWGGTLNWALTANYVDEITVASPGSPVNDYAGVLGSGGAAAQTGAPKWKGILAATYNEGPYSFTLQSRWYGSAILNNAWNTGNLATAATANQVAGNVFQVDPVAYLDLRAAYKWNENIQLYGALDNATDVPPPLVPGYSGGIQSNGGPLHTSSQYDLLGRTFRIGVRFNY